MNSSLASPEGMLGRSTVPQTRAIYLALGMAAVATLAYVLLRQDTTHQYDIYWMLPRLRDGLTDYPRHPFAGSPPPGSGFCTVCAGVPRDLPDPLVRA